jgi:ring-1,2-phenylacetyl-CoA epoxidase subunit PaaE
MTDLTSYELALQSYKGLSYFLGGLICFIVLFAVQRYLGNRRRHHGVVGTMDEEDAWTDLETLTIVDIINESPDVKTFRLKRDDHKPVAPFHAGQFVSVQIGNPEDKVLRSYSISSSCTNSHALDISVKKLEDGIGSCWFHERSKGDTVMAFPPAGLFCPSLHLDSDKHHLVLIAGGIGITPILSIIRSAVDAVTDRPITLFYACRSEADLAFRSLLDHYAEWRNTFTWIPILSQPDDSWSGLTGHLNLDIIAEHVQECNDASYYFCGPEGLTNTIIDALIENGHDEDVLHAEKFASPASMDESQFEERSATVTANGQELSYSGRTNLLDFLEEQDVSIDFACRSGVCGNCRAKLISGDVNSITDDGLTRQQKKDGFILCCVSRPESDIELHIP